MVEEGSPVPLRLPGEGLLYGAGRPVGPDVVGDGGRDAAEPMHRYCVPAYVNLRRREEPLVKGPARRVGEDVGNTPLVAVGGGQQRKQRVEIARRQVGMEDGDGEVVGRHGATLRPIVPVVEALSPYHAQLLRAGPSVGVLLAHSLLPPPVRSLRSSIFTTCVLSGQAGLYAQHDDLVSVTSDFACATSLVRSRGM